MSCTHEEDSPLQNDAEVLSCVDHTILSPTATWNDVRTAIDDAIAYGCASVCIPPSYVERAKKYADENGGVKICTVIGFPNGYSTTSTKICETADAINRGADEIDMVINLGWVKDGMFDEIEKEIGYISSIVRGSDSPGKGNRALKVIIETSELDDDEKVMLCDIATRVGVDYVKTSTGFAGDGALLSDVELLADHVGEGVKVKASGGISSVAEAARFIEAGADRIGASKVVADAKRRLS